MMSETWYESMGWSAASTWDSIMTIVRYVLSDEFVEDDATILLPDLAMFCDTFDEIMSDHHTPLP